MKYAKYWGAIASHSGDSYFDFIYRSDWPNTLAQLARFREHKQRPGEWSYPDEATNTGIDDGRVAAFLKHAWKREHLNPGEMHCLMNLCMAASYDPDPQAPNGFRLPFDLESGEIIPERWRAWLKHDPINLVKRYGKNLSKLSGVYIDCGWRDQYHIQYGNRILSRHLRDSDIEHHYEEFDGTHSGIDKRMDVSLPFLQRVLRA
jgi:hypothetical protein